MRDLASAQDSNAPCKWIYSRKQINYTTCLHASMSRFSTPEELEKVCVRDVYDQIAPHFAHSKYKAWPKVEQFLCSFPTGSLIADVGCGTGRYLGLSDHAFIVGAERCAQFAEIARDRKHEVVVCDNIALPYRKSCLDGIISVGVIHHFATVKRRLTALREMARVLRPGGKLLVCVWAVEQSERKFDGTDVLVPYKSYHKTRGKRSVSRKRATVSHPGFRKYTGQRYSEENGTTRDHDECTVENDDKDFHCLNLNGHDVPTEDVPEARKETKMSKLFPNLENHALFNNVFKMLKGGPAASKDSGDDRSEENTKNGGIMSLVMAKLFENRRNSHEEETGTESDESRSCDSSPVIRRLRTTLNACDNRVLKSSKLSTVLKPCRERNLVQLRTFSNSSSAGEHNSSLEGRVTSRGYSHCIGHKNNTNGLCSPKMMEYGSDYYVDDGLKARSRTSDKTTRNNPPIGLSLLVRLMESISSSSSDTDSDSSISSDYFNSDSGASDTDHSEMISPKALPKPFAHSTVCCQAPPGYSSSCVMVNPIDSEKVEPTHPEKLQRYYHVFREGELVQLIESGVPSLKVVKEYYDHGNWAVIAEKLS